VIIIQRKVEKKLFWIILGGAWPSSTTTSSTSPPTTSCRWPWSSEDSSEEQLLRAAEQLHFLSWLWPWPWNRQLPGISFTCRSRQVRHLSLYGLFIVKCEIKFVKWQSSLKNVFFSSRNGSFIICNHLHETQTRMAFNYFYFTWWNHRNHFW